MVRRTHAGTGDLGRHHALGRGVGASRRALAIRALGVAAGLAVVGCGKTKNVTPADVAMQFYVTLELGGVREVPEPRALVALEPYLTPELTADLQAARTRRDAPLPPGSTDKPPFADGNPFSSLFEGHSTYRMGSTTMRGDTALVAVSFTNVDQKPAIEWKDTVMLLPKGTGDARTWRIADIRYGTAWEFGFRGSLRGVLGEARKPDPTSAP